jgi:Kinesin motor domain
MNPITSIKQDFIRDHKSYLLSYTNHMKGAIPNDCVSGLQKLKQYKELVSELTIRYPRIMAYTLNPREANQFGITHASIQNDMINQVGGDLASTEQNIQHIKSIIGRLSDIKLDEVQAVAKDITSKLRELEHELGQAEGLEPNQITDKLNPDTVISNLTTVLTTLEGEGDNYERVQALTDVSVPAKQFSDLDEKKESIKSMIEAVSDISSEYSAVFDIDDETNRFIKEVMRIIIKGESAKNVRKILESNDFSTHYPVTSGTLQYIIKSRVVELSQSNPEPLSEFKTQAISEIMHLIQSEKAFEIPIDQYQGILRAYIEKIKDIKIQVEEIEDINGALQQTIGILEDQIMGPGPDTPEEFEQYSTIQSYLLPKLSTTIATLRYAQSKIEGGDDIIGAILANFDESLGERSSELYPIVAIGGKYDEFRQKFIPHFESIDRASSGASPDLRTIELSLKAIHDEISYPRLGFDYKKIIDRIQENFRGSDAAKVNEFLKFYNRTMTQGLVDEVNQLVAREFKTKIDNNQSTLADGYRVVTVDNMVAESLKKLTTKKVMNAINPQKEGDIQSIQTVVANARNAFFRTGEAPRGLNFDGLEKPINSIEDAKVFTYKYNNTAQRLDYPEMIATGLPSQIRLIPAKFFTGGYTHRIVNTVFKEVTSETYTKVELLDEIFNIDEDNFGIKTVKGIYEPDFNILKQVMTGGGLDIAELEDMLEQRSLPGSNQDKLANIETALITLSDSVMHLSEAFDKYNRLVAEYSINYNHIYSYMRFLILIATNQFFTQNYVVYRYINKGTIEFYKRVMNNMICDLEMGSSEPHVAFVRKYYYAVVYRLMGLLDNASYYLAQSTDILDIQSVDQTAPALRNALILLNYFKPILESYNEMFQNQITIYARLNDIKTEIDYEDKVFVSDLEEKEYGDISLKQRMTREESSETGDASGSVEVPEAPVGAPVEVPVQIESIRQRKPRNRCKRDVVKSNAPDTSIMWTRKGECRPYVQSVKAKAEEGEEPDLRNYPTKFTEVFDSVNFPENSDISKYMTLETQLAKKKGVCIMTYGYSGTGKTYTLFGNKNREGVLKSTLVNINGLEKVQFRLYELYGRGLPYKFYWEDDAAADEPGTSERKSRLDQIYHRIFHYNLASHKTHISVEPDIQDNDIVEVMPNNFRDYIEDCQTQGITGSDTTYIDIDRENVSEVFGNFSSFTDNIDLYRKSQRRGADGEPINLDVKRGKEYRNIKRIRETPNNPESSRSILVYDFNLFIRSDDPKDSVRFMIIDLPGREEISQTYIDPYIDNFYIKALITRQQNLIGQPERPITSDRIDLIRMIISSMALNPMALGVFDCKMIFDIYNEKYANPHITMADMNKRILDNHINDQGVELRKLFEVVDGKLEKITEGRPGTIVGYQVPRQYYGMASIFIMTELIKAADFDTIEMIYEAIIDEHINKPIDDTISRLSSEQTYNLMVGLLDTKFKGTKTLELIHEIVKILLLSEDVAQAGAPVISEEEEQLGLIDDLKRRKTDIVAALTGDGLGQVKELLTALIKYDYLLTPFEGIYINENIIGLIKFLSDKLIKSGSNTNKVKIEEQPYVTVDDQRNITRVWMMSKGLSEQHDESRTIRTRLLELLSNSINSDFDVPKPGEEHTQFMPLFRQIGQPISENDRALGVREEEHQELACDRDIQTDTASGITIDLIPQKMNVQQKLMTRDYAPEKIFNPDNPLITDILEPYIDTGKAPRERPHGCEHKEIKKIKDYKIFYLFGNYDDPDKAEFKCEHQIKLLENTENFIQAVS